MLSVARAIRSMRPQSSDYFRAALHQAIDPTSHIDVTGPILNVNKNKEWKFVFETFRSNLFWMTKIIFRVIKQL